MIIKKKLAKRKGLKRDYNSILSFICLKSAERKHKEKYNSLLVVLA
jgi:hypothetical protein